MTPNSEGKLKHKILLGLAVSLVTALIFMGLLELYIRSAVYDSSTYGHEFFGEPFRYGDYFSDDNYWKIRHILKDEHKPPKNPHPILGWVGDFDPGTYVHDNVSDIRDRTPVLLYGDSFAQCATDICFQDLLNEDPGLSKDYFMLNYGVSGYGTDQIKLLYDNSIENYDEPIVIISLLTNDLDRSILSFRTGQKPYFEPANGSLELKGVPISSNADEFLNENPVSIKSYLWNFVISSRLMPEPLGSKLRGDQKKLDRKILVNELILGSIIEDLEKKGIPYFFIVFHANWPDTILSPDTWRDEFLRDFLDTNNVPYIWTKGLLKQDMEESGRGLEDYFLPGHGHYTDYANTLVTDEIKKRIEEKEYNIPRARE